MAGFLPSPLYHPLKARSRFFRRTVVISLIRLSLQGVKVVVVGFFNIADLANVSKREEWVDGLLTKAIAGHADGVNIDMEGPISKGSKQVMLLNELTANVYEAFKKKLPGSQVI